MALRAKDKQAATDRVTADEIKTAIMMRHAPPEWHTETEVTLGGRRLDVVALNLWGARRYRTIGFEVKVSRGDWRHELSEVNKSAEWLAVVDQFYIVAPKGIVPLDELPRGWGLLEWHKERMYNRATPPLAEKHVWPREVVARFLTRQREVIEATRRQVDAKDRAVLNAVRNDIRAEVEAEWKERGHHQYDAEVVRKAERYTALMQELGLVHDWAPEESIKRAIRLMRNTRADAAVDRALDALKHHAQHVESMREQMLPLYQIFHPEEVKT